ISVTFILGIANLIGGLPLIFHNVKNFSPEVRPLLTQAWRWSKARPYMVLAPLSCMFRGSDDTENEMMDVAGASVTCIALLALGKVMPIEEPRHTSRLIYYLTIVMSLSRMSCVAGVLIMRLLEHFGTIDQGCATAPHASLAILSFRWCTYDCLGLILKS
ncbi:hypothetical protein ZWY2020_028920, partial [Hordeum vulgare]